MAAFDEIFTHVPAHRIAVCREHGGVVTAKSVASHVGRHHGYVGAQERREVVEAAAALQRAGTLAADIGEVRVPETVVAAVAGLAVWADGKKCVQCGHIYRLRQHIQAHCRAQHG